MECDQKDNGIFELKTEVEKLVSIEGYLRMA